MKKLNIRALTILVVLPVFIFTVAITQPTARAISSCPTDPLSAFTPNNTNFDDSGAVDVGVKFNVHGAPFVRGAKFYKGVDNTGTHVAHLYDFTTSTELASATYTSESSSGWQTVNFSSDIPVIDTHTYMLWVSMPNGHYAVDSGNTGGSNYFDSTLAHGQYGNSEDVVYIPSGDSGWYEYEPQSGAPGNATKANYWISPVVGDTTAPAANTGLTAVDDPAGPIVSWTGAGKDSNAATSTGEPVRTSVQRIQGETSDWIVGTSNSSATWFESNDPTALPGTGYTYITKNTDACGNTTSSTGATVTTASQSLSHIFSGNPTDVDTSTDPVTVGLRWHADVAGYVWGVRIYRAPGTQYTGNLQNSVQLWEDEETVLGTRAIPHGNNQSGWIDVRFEEPIAVDANHDYTVSYTSWNGQVGYTNGALENDVTNGHLTSVADSSLTPNGGYSSTIGLFPGSRTSYSPWYGVDVDWYPAS